MNNFPFLEIEGAALNAASSALPADAPCQMLNLLRYRERADYSGAAPESPADLSPCSGREAYYGRYIPAFNATLAGQNIEGVKVFWLAGVATDLVAPAGEAWDDAVIVQYPNFAAFRRLVENDQYSSHAAPHRLAALADWRLLAVQAHSMPDADAPDADAPDAKTIWATYQKAWEDVSDDERRDLLKRSLAPDCVYTDPSGATHNTDELVAYIENSRAMTPGATFINHEFIPHHGHSLAQWTLYDASGATLSEGTSYAHFGADGRLSRIAGFFAAPEAELDEAELATWKTYQGAWLDIDAGERRDLLAQSVAPDGVYFDPTDECAGHADIIGHIEESQRKTPGVSFRNDEFVTHHGQGLSSWTMLDGTGAEVIAGHSYARFGDDGLLTQMTGFFKKG